MFKIYFYNFLDYENLEDFYRSITSNTNSKSILNEEIEENNFLFKENEIFSFEKNFDALYNIDSLGQFLYNYFLSCFFNSISTASICAFVF